MDGKLVTGVVFLAAPAAVIGATVAWFGSNPVTIFAMFALMLCGAFYLMTYREAFA
jgi:hypothetical protein